MAITDVQLRSAKPAAKIYKIYDAFGLYFMVTPTGGKLWRFKYRFDGKERLLALGKYPIVSLLEARNKRDEARKLLDAGIDPGDTKRIAKQRQKILVEDTFEIVARDWFARHLINREKSHYSKVVRRLEMYVFPYIGQRPITSITAPDILQVARRVENLGSIDTAHRVKGNISQVITYAIQIGRAETNPAIHLRGALPPVPSDKHFAAPDTTTQSGLDKVGELLRMFDSFKGTPVVCAAIKILPMVFCRPAELRMMKWADIDFEKAEWRYTVTKTRTDHLVPLSTQVISLLKELYPLTGNQQDGYVFSGGRSPLRPISDAAINAAYKRLGIDTKNELTGHGWRSVARTVLHERLEFEPAVIEHQLAHAVKDINGTAYNRTKFLDKRRQMMQVWADYLDKLKKGSS